MAASGVVVLAAQGDTWGISGPAFLSIYGWALVGVAGLVFLMRQRMLSRADGSPVHSSSQLHGDYAYLTGGLERAVNVAVVSLCEQGYLCPAEPHGWLQVARRPAPGVVGPVEQMVLDGVGAMDAARPSQLVSRLARDPRVVAAHGHLAGSGFVASPQQVRTIRALNSFFLPLLGIGLIRLVFGVSRHRPVGFLVGELVVTVLLVIVATLPWRGPLLTSAGHRVVRQARADFGGLRSGGLQGERALAVSLFGLAALWTADRNLAGWLGFDRPRRDGSSFGGGSSGSCGGGYVGGGGCGGGHGGGGGGCGGGGGGCGG
ncbi:TIGR04222 domain-containing membrane protein [Frankia sp. R43]|uniref:TIGR04222 domain-containing membrane protein n=1 Tax=Frankia sp. R43 TaxID=269536 RepID=UPI00137A849E|nr:TIGR04222 domain-containing membrane protein [Frankia sp. R43]